jgi:antitoxin component of RelBE/YafQ-DinJ toxin-antitoxin module
MDTIVHLRINSDLKEKFIKIADSQGVTISELIRQYIESLVVKAAN